MSLKNRAFMALLLISFLGSSCQKVVDMSVMPPQENAEIQKTPASKVENLGHVFSGSNVAWKLHPHGGGQLPLFMHLPYNNTGYNLLMIDNGELNGYTPKTPFKFISVNLYTKTSKIIHILSKGNNMPVQTSVGRIIRMTFGMNKKLYVATEGAPDGGGHLIEYDPNTEKAYDLGKPFKVAPNYHLSIYSLSVGIDSALYGGSFGGNGEVYTFRYDYKNNWYVDAAPIDDELRYVANVTGDSRYTYAACGKNKWRVIAIDRTTGAKKVVLNADSQIGNVDAFPHTDAVYCKIYQHFKMNGFNEPTAIPFGYRPATPRIAYAPYGEDDPTVPEVNWVPTTKKVEYRFPSGEQGVVSIDGVHEEVYDASAVSYANNNLYVVGGKPSSLAVYKAGKATVLGSFPFSVYCLTSGNPNTADANKMFFSGYPKGNLYEFKVTDSWYLPSLPSQSSGGSTATPTNPSMLSMMQNADANGVNGPMTTGGVVNTKNGYVVVAGNNDRITNSGSRELSIGCFKNQQVKNHYTAEFANFEFASMCLSADSNFAFVLAYPKHGGSGKIYKYDPVNNIIVNSWAVAELNNYGAVIESYSNNLLFAALNDVFMLFDLQKEQVVYKKTLGPGRRVSAIQKGLNKTIYSASMSLAPGESRIHKITLDAENTSLVFTLLAEVKDDDGVEGQPRSLAIVPVGNSLANIYVGGMRSLYRINNVQL